MIPHAFTPAWRAGYSAGYRAQGRSLWRRCLVSILLSAMLLTASATLFWTSWGVFAANEAGPVVKKTIVSKWEGVARTMGVRK
jgi:hypothetical protein